jgi:single-stranded-DNA-specific exonuclease
VTEFGVPTFAFAKVGDHYVGSGRSTGGLHLVEAMKSCGDIFIKFGGHPEACGLTVANLDRLQEFADKVDIFAAGHFAGKILKPELRIDIPWPVERIDWSTLATIEQLQPYGQKNPKPIFVAHNARIKEAKAVGAEGKHLKITLGAPVPRHVSCIGFNLGEYADQIKPNMLIDFVYQLDRSSWNDNDQIQVQILDITI